MIVDDGGEGLVIAESQHIYIQQINQITEMQPNRFFIIRIIPYGN